MHIAFFNRAFHPEQSATSQLLTELAEGLVRDHGCRVTVVAGAPPGTSKPEADGEFNGIRVLRARGTTFPKSRFAGRAANYVSYFGAACVKGLGMERPDVVVALTDPPIAGLAAGLAARRFRCPLVISFRDLFPEVGRLLEDFQSPLVDGLLTQVNRILIHQAQALVALGTDMRNRLIEKGARADKITIIPDWADLDAVTPGPKRNPFSIEQGLADSFVVMHSGNLGLSQNLETVLEAAGLLKHLPGLQFVFCGEGLKKTRLQARARQMEWNHVRFLPYQPKENLSDLFSSADCFVVSLKPGLWGYITPSKLYGILAAGRPYVAAVDAQCDAASITQQDRCGLLAEPGNPEELAERIERLYRNPDLAREMGERSRAAAARFSRAGGVRAYYELFQRLTR